MLYFIRAILFDAACAFGLSGLFSLIRMLFHGNVTRGQFFGGAAILFLVFFLDGVYHLIRTWILMKQDPEFEHMTKATGISWKEYKRMKDGKH